MMKIVSCLRWRGVNVIWSNANQKPVTSATKLRAVKEAPKYSHHDESMLSRFEDLFLQNLKESGNVHAHLAQ